MPSKKREGISFPKLVDIIDSTVQGEGGGKGEAISRPLKKTIKKKKRTTVVLKTEIKDPERFLLRPDTWQMLDSAQLGKQCKMVGIPCGGSKEDRIQRLVQWRKDPAKFERAEATKKKRKKAKSAVSGAK